MKHDRRQAGYLLLIWSFYCSDARRFPEWQQVLRKTGTSYPLFRYAGFKLKAVRCGILATDRLIFQTIFIEVMTASNPIDEEEGPVLASFRRLANIGGADIASPHLPYKKRTLGNENRDTAVQPVVTGRQFSSLKPATLRRAKLAFHRL